MNLPAPDAGLHELHTLSPNPVVHAAGPFYVEGLKVEFDYDALSTCIHCGYCLSVCPTYQVTRSESASPRGRIQLLRAAAEGHLPLEGGVSEALDLCLGCRACETACPVGVPYGEIHHRARLAIDRRRTVRPPIRFLRKVLLRGLISRPHRLRRVARFLRWYQQSGLQAFARRFDLPRRILGRLGEMEAAIPPISPAGVIGSTAAPTEKGASTAPASTAPAAAVFRGCVQDALMAGTNAATARLLEEAGFTVQIPPGIGCCGAVHDHAGDHAEALRLARQNIAAFERSGARYLVVNAGGCGAFLKEYPALFEDDPAWKARAEAFSARVRDLSELLAETDLAEKFVAAPDREPVRVTYQDSCHLLHGQGIGRQPRELLQAIPGTTFVELEGAGTCCGSAGIYNLVHGGMADDILDRKMDQVRDTGAHVIVTSNPGCYLQMRLGVARQGLEDRIQVVQLADFLALHLPDRTLSQGGEKHES